MTGTGPKLAGFAATLVLAFGGAYAVGAGTDPIAEPESEARPATPSGQPEMGDMGEMGTTEPQPHASTPTPTATASAGHGDEHGGEATTTALPGLAVSDSGYTLEPASSTVPAGPRVPFRFRITDPDGHALTSYDVEHEKELHLIVVRRDLAGFQHVHPVRAADGTWSIPLDLRKAGTWRVFADFKPKALDRGLTLGTDLTVAGSFTPVPLPPATTTAKVDGYDVTLAGTATAGTTSDLTFTVRRDGKPVTDLQPYLGAFGHLVSLRTGDLAYLHTHPAQEAHAGDSGGPQVKFGAEFPTAGSYRLFLDFKHGGAVRTAEFTVTVGGGHR
jgi:hypothetical protein